MEGFKDFRFNDGKDLYNRFNLETIEDNDPGTDMVNVSGYQGYLGEYKIVSIKLYFLINKLSKIEIEVNAQNEKIQEFLEYSFGKPTSSEITNKEHPASKNKPIYKYRWGGAKLQLVHLYGISTYIGDLTFGERMFSTTPHTITISLINYDHLLNSSRKQYYEKSLRDFSSPSNVKLSKDSLLLKTPNEEKVKQDNNRQPDIDFSPFIGKSITTVNLRQSPSSKSKIIGSIYQGSTVYIFSPKDVSGYYKVIDINSGLLGWAHKNYFQFSENIIVEKSGAFHDKGYVNSYESEVIALNSSSSQIMLIVGEKTFHLPASSEKIIYIPPGQKYYVASAVGVIPASGVQEFKPNHGYEWKFWIE